MAFVIPLAFATGILDIAEPSHQVLAAIGLVLTGTHAIFDRPVVLYHLLRLADPKRRLRSERRIWSLPRADSKWWEGYALYVNKEFPDVWKQLFR